MNNKYTVLFLMGMFFGVLHASEPQEELNKIQRVTKADSQKAGFSKDLERLVPIFEELIVYNQKQAGKPKSTDLRRQIQEDFLPLIPQQILQIAVEKIKRFNFLRKSGDEQGKIPNLRKMNDVEKKDVEDLMGVFHFLQAKLLMALLMFEHGKEYCDIDSRGNVVAKYMKMDGLPKAIQEDIDKLTFSIRELIALGRVKTCSYAEKFDLSCEKIDSLDGLRKIKGLENLIELRLERNQLTLSPKGAFQSFTLLRKLDLSHNQLKSLPEGAFHGLESLEQLYLNHNKLTSLPEKVFQGLSRLDDLFLGDNQLTNLPEGVFQGLNSLRRLGLSRNQLTSLPERVFQRLEHLVILGLSGNQLTSLPEKLFQGLKYLGHLHLQDNRLISLPGKVLQGLGGLYVLDLRHNQLTSLSVGAFQGLDKLRELYLSSNQLTSLQPGVFQEFKDLIFFYLEDNPLTSLHEGLFQEVGVRKNSYFKVDYKGERYTSYTALQDLLKKETAEELAKK